MQLTQRLLPRMREQHYGRVITVGSMLASFPTGPSRFLLCGSGALREFAMSARQAFAVQGVGRPRGTRSIAAGIGERRTTTSPTTRPTGTTTTMIAHLDANEKGGITPAKVAKTVVKAIEADKPRSSRRRVERAAGVHPQAPRARSWSTTMVACRHGLEKK